MESKVKLMGHPAHQTLVVFPLGLLAGAAVFDLVHLVTGGPTMAVVSYWMLAAGLIGGVVAAPFGTIDWLSVPRGTRARRIGLLHGLGNLVVLLLFGASFWLRSETDPPGNPGSLALSLSWAGIVLALFTAWLGGELVSRLGVGVAPDAHLDAPNSLRHEARQAR